jgi:hypothetical protein
VKVADDRGTGHRLSSLDGTGEAVSAATRWREIEIEVL